MSKLFAVLQTLAETARNRLNTKTDAPEAGLESVQVIIITAVGLVIVLAVMNAITGLADEWIAKI